MTVPAIHAKSFLTAMKLPDDQRRKMLEKLGAKMMDQLEAEHQSPQRNVLSGKLVAKSA